VRPVWNAVQNQVTLSGVDQDAERALAIPAGIDALSVLGDPLHEHPLLPRRGRSEGSHEANSTNLRPLILASLTDHAYVGVVYGPVLDSSPFSGAASDPGLS